MEATETRRTTRKGECMNVRVDKELLDKFKDYCEEHGYTQSKVFRKMLIELLKKEGVL